MSTDACGRSVNALVGTLIAGTLILTGLVWAGPACASDQLLPPEKRIPRYGALTGARIEARAYPEFNAPVKWVYTVRDLPVQVVAVTQDWLRICDPDGSFAWVRRRSVGRQATVLNVAGRPLALRRRDAEDAPVIGYLRARSLAQLGGCTPTWCRITVDSISGWAPRDGLWGVARGPQCRITINPLGASGQLRN